MNGECLERHVAVKHTDLGENAGLTYSNPTPERELVVVIVACAAYADFRSCSSVHPARGRCCNATSKRWRIIVK